jgi:integral membrane protein
MLSSAIGRFRLMGFIEGLSLLILLFIAMPLKYYAGLPEVVTVIGSLHGVFFIMYLVTIAYVTFKIRWSFIWVSSAIAVAFIPFGNLFLDAKLRKSRY